jgi:branched-subunit amino acid aminotransferase/4-amino-4-deoxychorismate lyase
MPPLAHGGEGWGEGKLASAQNVARVSCHPPILDWNRLGLEPAWIGTRHLLPPAREGNNVAMTGTPTDRIELNGAPARVEDLRALVQTNYGHFTAMQVRECCVRGLELHLDRLVHAARELFDSELDRERLRGYLRHAIGVDTRPLSLRVNIFSRALDRTHMTAPAGLDVLIIVSAAATPAVTPLCLKSFRYQRELPNVKHVGTFPLFHYRRLAQQAGFDDALFVTADGDICEASVWNIGFHDGRGIVWPDGPQLDGIGMRLLQAGLARSDVPSAIRPVQLHEVPNFRAAFLTNSTAAVCPVVRIDDIEFPPDDALAEMLAACHETNAWETVG